MEFGASIASHGFNLFALGLPGSGKTTLIREYLERRAINQPVPLDLCYVNNFLDARRPTALRLPAGHGPQFQRDIAALIVELREAIPKAFETKEYDEQRDTIVHDVEAKVQAELTRLEEYVARRNFQLVPTSSGLMLLPTVNGKLISESELQLLKPDEQQKLIEQRNRLGEDVEEGVRRKRELEKGARDALRALDAETATYAVSHIVAELRTRYSDRPEVLTYLDALQADVIEHADNFRKGREAEAAASPIGFTPPGEDPFTRYKVNVLIDNHTLTGAPVIVESNPTYQNLVGRIEHKAIWGAVLTDFTMIKPGALQRANGGYLIIPARECLLNP
ncbi:MAG TPA: ATP-binding protein, partial [Anaerolineae bacterium]|nr:ATP-binding protein [Anaerolineae bacterium]